MIKNKVIKSFKNGFNIFRKSAGHFMSNRPVEMAGTTAYFSIFSMAPIIIIIVAVFGLITSDEVIREKLFEEIGNLVGPDNVLVLEVGAIFTSIFFAAGRVGIGMFVGNSNMGQVYGAASSIIIILIWIYFASLIFYFGVELTYQYSKFHNHSNEPASFAVPFEINRIR